MFEHNFDSKPGPTPTHEEVQAPTPVIVGSGVREHSGFLTMNPVDGLESDPAAGSEFTPEPDGEIRSVERRPYQIQCFSLANLPAAPIAVPFAARHLYARVMRNDISAGITAQVMPNQIGLSFNDPAAVMDFTHTERFFHFRRNRHWKFTDARNRIAYLNWGNINANQSLVVIATNHELPGPQMMSGSESEIIQTTVDASPNHNLPGLLVNALQMSIRSVLGAAITRQNPAHYTSQRGNVTAAGNLITTIGALYGIGRKIEVYAGLISGAVTDLQIQLLGLENGVYSLIATQTGGVLAITGTGAAATPLQQLLSYVGSPFPQYAVRVTTLTGGGTAVIEVRAI